MDNLTNRDIGVRFTDEKYAKRADVRNELGTSNIDPFWVKIISYRAKYTKNLSLNTSSKLNFYMCSTPAINLKCEAITKKLNKCLDTYNNLDSEGQDVASDNLRIKLIKNVALYYGETISQEMARTFANGGGNNLQGISEAKRKSLQYFKVHSQLINNRTNINSDYVYDIYLKFINKTPSGTVYRGFDLPKGDDFSGVSSLNIERMMDNLFRFLLDPRVTTIVKASAAYYFINYVKPYESYNEEIALQVFKSTLALGGLENVAFLIPFENFLVKQSDFIVDFKEVNRGNDLTYALLKVIEASDEAADKFLDYCINTRTETLEEDHHFKEETSVTDVPANNEAVNTIKEEVKVEKPHIQIVKGKNISVDTIELSLEEKDANKFERTLLMQDPYLSKKQAHFFARHCTLGNYYTIQMFKKKEKVVYETARTSMDQLTNLGYYRKDQIKNKFVYTPIKRKDKDYD